MAAQDLLIPQVSNSVNSFLNDSRIPSLRRRSLGGLFSFTLPGLMLNLMFLGLTLGLSGCDKPSSDTNTSPNAAVDTNHAETNNSAMEADECESWLTEAKNAVVVEGNEAKQAEESGQANSKQVNNEQANDESLPSIATLPIFNAATLQLICDKAIADAKAGTACLAKMPIADVSVVSFLNVWDYNAAKLEDGVYPAYLLANVSPDPAVREAGQACILQISEFETELYQNRALYERVNELATSTTVESKYRQDLLHAFEDSGVALDDEARARAKELSLNITKLSQEFQKNVRENKDTVTFTPAEVAGMSEDWLNSANRDDDGNYVVTYDYPFVYPFLEQAENAEARKRYMTGFYNRGTAANLKLLDEIMQNRYELAQLHNLPSYAHLITARRMVENPETVHSFLDEVAKEVTSVELQNLTELAALKQQETQDPNAVINRWDMSYYKEKLKQQQYSIDQEALRQYFPTEASVKWAIAVSEKLYNITVEQNFAPVWHPDVQFYEVYLNNTEAGDETDENTYIGSMYLDLYPRDGKYKHAAAFPVRSVSTQLDRQPISVLVTNFNRKGLTHREVETLFHEFGHVLHGVLSKTQYVAHAGTSVSRDFVEAPSQMFEEWASRRESLNVLQEVCAECPAISDEMLERLRQAQNFGQGLHYARQHLYASFDMALAGPKPQPAQEVWVKMESATPLGHIEGTEFPGSFGHIAGGYAAGYYGYMWSEVLANDMLSAFGDNVMNEEVGKRYRDIILRQGGQKPAKDLVESFLQRPVNSDAFFETLSESNSETSE